MTDFLKCCHDIFTTEEHCRLIRDDLFGLSLCFRDRRPIELGRAKRGVYAYDVAMSSLRTTA